MAGVEGLEPSRTVLETDMLPLHHTPKECPTAKKSTHLILFQYNIHSVKLQIEPNGIARVRR